MASYVYDRDLRICKANPGFTEIVTGARAASARIGELEDALPAEDVDGGYLMWPLGFTDEWAIVYHADKWPSHRAAYRPMKLHSFTGHRDHSGAMVEACDVWGR